MSENKEREPFRKLDNFGEFINSIYEINRSNVPFYTNLADYNTNSTSYYDDLGRKAKLFEILAHRIWEYDEELAKRFEEWDENLEQFPEEVEKLLKEWLTNGEMDRIVNEAFGLINDIYVNVTLYNAVDDGITDNTPMIKEAEENGHLLYFPKKIGNGYVISELPNKKALGQGAFLRFENPEYKLVEDCGCGKYYDIYLDDKALDVNSFWQTYIQLNNTDLGVNAAKKLDKDSYGNVAIGNNAMRDSEENVTKNIAIGHNAINKMTEGYQNTAVGTDVMRDSVKSERNTVIGGNAGISMGDTVVTENSYMFRQEIDTTHLDELWPDWRQYAGGVTAPKFIAKNRADARGNTAVGRNSMGWTVTPEFCVAMGYNALEKGLNAKNTTSIGINSLYNTIRVNDTTAVGGYTQSNTSSTNKDTVLGTSAMRDLPHSANSVAIGFQSLIGSNMKRDNPTVDRTVAVGRFTLANATGSINRNTAIGDSALRYNKGEDNTAVGEQALRNNNGDYNTAIGKNAGGFMENSSNATAIGYNSLNTTDVSGFTNITGVGQNSTVTGSNQLMLGNSETTPYAWNALQLRSDKRDKSDIKPISFGLDFINRLNPVLYKWDIRNGNKGKRNHSGLIAQELKEVMEDMGIDFGVYQDHKVNGGSDVLTVGYEELIAPLIKSVQDLSKEVEELKKELGK